MEAWYIWKVTLGEQTVELLARDRLEATKKAAQKLGVRWSQTVRDMEALRLRRAQRV